MRCVAEFELAYAAVIMLALLLVAAIVPLASMLARFFVRVPWRRLVRFVNRSPNALAKRLGITLPELENFMPSYRAVEIPKRSGGTRTLQIPDDATKKLQRLILRRILRNLRSHPAAHAYERGRSIVTNARHHAGQQYVLKFDLEDFFPSTSEHRVERYFRRIGWSRKAAKILTRLTVHEEGLPQGAPTSPRLSNLLNFKLDAALQHRAHRWDATYTRYADDITISVTIRKNRFRSRILMSLRQTAFRAAHAAGYKVHRSPRKLHVLQQHHRQTVTGLVVNRKVQLSRKQRRLLRAAEHRLKTGKPTTLTPAQIQGWRALQSMIDKQRDNPA
jgi:retron-type reverse transcriptase